MVYQDKDNYWRASACPRLNNGKRHLSSHKTRGEAETAELIWGIKNNYISSAKDMTLDTISDYLTYEAYSGELIYKVNTGKHNIGDIATHTRKDGYKTIWVGGKLLLAHRVIWYMLHGSEPAELIDHIDQNPSNNRLENLRETNQSLNLKNTKRRTDNTSGTTGVYWSKEKQRWSAVGWSKGKRYHIGYFELKMDAIKARKIWAASNGFTRLHGELS